MHVQGVSTRKVSAIVEELCGHSVVSTQVSQCRLARLDTQLLASAGAAPGRVSLPVPGCPLTKKSATLPHCNSWTARSSLPRASAPRANAPFWASAPPRAKPSSHWRQFLNSLQGRGLHGSATSSSATTTPAWAHPPGRLSRRAPAALPVPSPKNAQVAFVPRLDQRAAVADAIRSVFNCPNRPAAERLLPRKSSRPMPCPPCKLVRLARKTTCPRASPSSRCPPHHQRRLACAPAKSRWNASTRNSKRRTRVARLFPE